MNGEVQLIVKPTVETKIFAYLNGSTYGQVGNQRIGVLNYSSAPALAGQTITLINANGDTQINTVTTVGTDFPVPGVTTINFTTPFTYDFREVAGGYFVDSIIQSYILDLYENESISQNWRFTDLNNFQSLGAFSREFRVPFSTRNQSALGALFDVNVDAGAANFFHYKLPAEIRVDTLPIASGYIRVRKVYKQQGKINEVELAFYAETPDLVKKIGEKKLKDIVDLPTNNEVIGYDLVTTPLTNRIWTILDRGQLWSENEEANTRPLLDSTNPAFPADLTPALNWWYLFSNIVADAGFELEAGSLENIINQYWMPWCNSRFLIGSDTTGAFAFRATNSASIAMGILAMNNEVFDNNGDYNPATYTYTAPAYGVYFFNFSLLVNVTAPSARVFIQAIRNGTEVYNIIDVNFTAGVTNWNFSDSLLLDAGDTVRWVSYKQGTGNATFNAGSSISLAVANLNYSQTISYPLNAPDVKQIDFVNDVLKMHNCAIIPDRTNPLKIVVVPQNSYFGSGATLDWTKKLDISKDSVMYSTVELQKSKFMFTYTAGEDILNKQYKNVNRVYGDYEAVGYTVNPDTAPSDFITGDQKIQLTTQSTPSGVVNGSGYVMPMFINESLQYIAQGSRCLYEAGAYQIELFDEDVFAPQLTSVPVLNNYSVIAAELDDYDLNWAPEVPPHPIVTSPYNNLFNLYWRAYMNALYSPEARILEASFALDLKDILTFSFADKIWINDSYWRILEINDYKVGMNESTSVKLIKFLEDAEDCASTPSSVSVNGEVVFVDANGDPASPTQDCCTRYGYDWDEVNAVCWANIPNGERPNSPTSGSSTNPAPRSSKAGTRNANILDSVITGEEVAIESGNKDMLAVGTDLTLTKSVEGSNLLGKNVTTNLPGIHVGGGYRNGDPTSIYYGWAQFGTFVLQKQITVSTSGDIFDLDIEGRNGEYIEMDDDTVWSCLLNVTIKDASGTYETSLHHFTLDKYGSAANASAITTINTIGAIGTNVFTFGIDTTTDPAQHRINVTVTGGTYPENFVITASLQYQQSKTT